MPTTAYFCAEFGIDSNLPTYAGGLGILAGDTIKEAADRDFPMIGIGLLYQGKSFIQRIDENGWQTEELSLYDPVSACLRLVSVSGKPLYLEVNMAGETIFIKSYQIRMGDKTSLYFLTTDSHKNPDSWRSILSADYWGDSEAQIRQQMVLGVGGVKLLSALHLSPEFYHLNEGRPCFSVWEIVSQIMEEKGCSFEKAKEMAKKKIIYTNHTLLRSGNLIYDPALVKKYAQPFSDALRTPVETLLEDGLNKEKNEFSITDFSLNISEKVSAVSSSHAKLCQKEWPQKEWISITNGVHSPSWQNTHFRDPSLSDKDIWEIHNMRKNELMRLVLRRSGFGYDPNRLVVSWARRMAAYKKLDVLFEDISRLVSIIKKEGKPIQLLIAGKAHPGDSAAKEHIQKTIKFMAGDLSGHAIFVPNFDIALSRAMVQGSDVWLNTPEFGREACGTSGMKALSNGVLNLTVSDGWAAEVDWTDVGWVVDHTRYSESIYDTLEKDISPLFFEKRNEEGLPLLWIEMMKKSIILSKKFSTERMFDEYEKKLYI